jgi:type I restriction enzyme S subunit
MNQRVCLGDIIDVARGQVDPREAPYCDLLHVGGDNIESGSGRLSGLRAARELNLISGKYEFGPSDVLYSKIRPALNKVAVPDFQGICSADVYPLRPRPGRIERRYLAHLLRHDAFRSYAEKHSTRTNIPKINREALLAYELILPPIHEQLRAADILDRADAIRRKRTASIALTEDLLRSAFLEMFGNPVTNPKGWPVASLREVASLIDYGVTASANTQPVGPRFLRITDIQDNRVDWQTVPYCDCDNATAQRAQLAPGDIVFARTGATTGKSYWIRECPERSVFASYLIRVRPGPRVLSPYLAEFFQSAGYWTQIRSIAEGAAQPGVNATKLAAVRVSLPPIAVQATLSDVTSRVAQLRARADASSANAESLFAALVQHVFSGRKRDLEGAC